MFDLRTNINKSDGKPSPVKNVSFQQRKFSSPIVPNLSGMLLDFYQKNSLHIPKNNKFENFVHRTSSPPPYNTPLSVSTNHETELNLSISASSQQKTEKLLKAQTATNSLQSTTLRKNETDAIAKNDDLVSTLNCSAKKLAASYHPRIKYSNVNNKTTTPTVAIPSTSASSLPIPSISSTVIAAPVIQPPLIAPPPPPPPSAAAAIAAAAFFRGEYRNFHQLQAQEILNHQQSTHQPSSVPPTPPKNPPFYIPPPYMKNANSNDRSSENDDDSQSDDDHIDDDEDDDGKYPSIDDIHLIEGSKSGFLSQSLPPTENDYLSDESHKYSLMAAQALRNLEYSLSDYGGNGGEEQLYSCRHCGKKYRWKSTLRRHENVECGGKEPSHQCPYCPYKSKQRGNLGVHVRKHHSNLPQLASKRRSKYSQPRD